MIPGLRRAAAWAARPFNIVFVLFTVLAAFSLTVLFIGWDRAELFSPPPTPIIEDRSGGFLTEGESEYTDLGYWDVEGPINERVALCLTAIEDRRFYGHPGVDLRALARSAVGAVTGNDSGGASTIAMQVARMEYPARRTLLNKALEASTALFLTAKFGREKVLRHYMKLVPQGNQIHGVAYSARRFFRKPLSDVSLAEAAVLAALPREPGRMNVFTYAGFERAKARAGLILRLLFQRGQIEAEEYGSALRQMEVMPIPAREVRPFNSYHYILRFLGGAAVELPASYSRPLASSLDPDVQAMVQSVADGALGENRRLGADNVAVMVADRATGEVLAYVGSSAFFDAEHAGAIDYADTPRSSGSILKPFLFARGLDSGRFTPASILADLPFSVLSPRGEYNAANFDQAYLGPMLYRNALANSRNVPALRVLEGVGLEDFYAIARRLGLSRDSKSAEYFGYGLAIGGLSVTLTDLVAAYGTLANDGRELRLKWLREDGAPEAGAPVFSSYAARAVSLFLSDDLARLPSFPRMGALEFPFPVAIKTGTSQGYRDAWTVAYTSKYVVGLWMGNPDNRPMNRVAGVTSAVYVGEILRKLHPLEQEGIDAVPFPLPEGSVPVSVCVLSGEAAGPDCPSASVEYFRPAEAPHAECSVHRRFAVDARNGSVATQSTPPSRVAVRSFTVLPAVYSLWGAQHGYAAPPETGGVKGPTQITVTYPRNGARYLIDPDVPARFQSLPLQAAVTPRVAQIEWIVDGKPAGRAAYPYMLRLPLKKGVHTIRAVVPGSGERSTEITVTVE